MLKQTLIIFSFFASILLSQTPSNERVEIADKEKLGHFIPTNLKFQNSDGNFVQLKDLLDKPTIFTMVYYDCPGICTPLLNGVIDVVNDMKGDMIVGQDFNIVTVSFDHNETPPIASAWKNKHLKDLRNTPVNDGWKFLTGDSSSIRELTDSLGFFFKKDGQKDYLHGAAIIMVSPKGKIIRYMLGTKFLPFDIKMASAEALRGEPGPTVAKILDLCFKYDPEGRKYKLNLTRIIGTVMLTTVALFAFFLYRSGKKKDEIKNSNNNNKDV
jgi:protein SCO1/2